MPGRTFEEQRRIREAKAAAGVCAYCPNQVVPGLLYCQRCRVKASQRVRQKRRPRDVATPPERLRRFLSSARALDRPFTAVWEPGLAYAVHDLPDHHQTWRWKRALAGTWREWKRAYERTGNRLLISEVLAYLDMTDFEESSLPASHDYVIA